MFRDRTNLFISYRRTFPHDSHLQTTSSPTSPFLNGDGETTIDDIELGEYPVGDVDGDPRSSSTATLPPLFFDIATDIDDYLKEINFNMEQLVKLYRKNSLPGFDDKSHDEKLIEDLSFKILQYFQKCHNIIKKLENIFNNQFLDGKQLNKTELIILNNITKKYAQKIQWESNKFRVVQNNYLKFLNKDDLKPIFPKNDYESSQLLLQEEEEKGKESLGNDLEEYSKQTLQRQENKAKQSDQRYLEERDEEIAQLARGVFEVSTIFREMQSLIIDQGTVVDRIDYNLENTVIELRQANKELSSATKIQKRTQKCKIILLLTLCVIALFFFVMLKPHSSSTTKYETVPAQNPVSVQEPVVDQIGVSNDELDSIQSQNGNINQNDNQNTSNDQNAEGNAIIVDEINDISKKDTIIHLI